MLFNSLVFAVFFAVVYGLYLGTMRRLRLQNAILLAASLLFYGWWDWRFLGLLLLSAVVDFWAGAVLDRRVGGEGAPDDAPFVHSMAKRKWILFVSMATNLGVLGFFKYWNFFIGSAADLLRALGMEPHLPVLHVILPVGISFYTFQTMSYTIDVYRGQLRAVPSFVDFLLFVSFFPQLVAGPIVRAADLLPQVQRPRTITREGVEEGAWLAFWGLFKKVFIADNVGKLAEYGFSDLSPGGGAALVGTYAFAVQIYCDFSGYTDIARGCAKAMGFDFLLNFRLPYFATDPSDFWRRWHMSLSTWLRDYLYIPLGGSRGGTWSTCRNLMLTMVLGGLWHGANWTFVAWGAFHGALLVAHRLWTAGRPAAGAGSAWSAWGKRLVMFHLVCVGWVFFRAETMGRAVGMLHEMVFACTMGDARWAALLFYSAPLVLMQCAQNATGDLGVVRRLPWPVRGVLFAVLWFLLTTMGDLSRGEFIYFQF